MTSSAHHAEHHRLFNYNYGQYLTLWDRWVVCTTPRELRSIYGGADAINGRLFGTHRYPDHKALDPHRPELAGKGEKMADTKVKAA